MLYCIEFLHKNLDWLFKKILATKTRYFLFDLPGQVELYINHPSLKAIIKELKDFGFSLSTVHLVDSCSLIEEARFLSAATLSLTAAISLDTSVLHVVSKMDLLKQLGKPTMRLSFYQDL